MENYYRITSYHPESDISAIIDSNGLFDKLWKFSAMLVQKGFKILEVGNSQKFDFGDIPSVEQDKEHIIIRACGKGQPIRNDNTVEVNGKQYKII